MFGLEGMGKEAEEIKPSFLLSSAFYFDLVSEALTAAWHYSLISLNMKHASLCLLPAMCHATCWELR